MIRLLAGVLLLVTVTSGCGAKGVGQESPAPGSGRPVRDVVASESSATPAPATDQPKHLRLAWIDAPVVPVREANRVLTPPDDPSVLGWWGRPAGSDSGTTLLVGHTVHTGGGELDALEHVPVGTRAYVSGHTYVVTENLVISKTALAKRAAHLFQQDGPPQLVVVTCEGYDPSTGEYHDNVVLIAKKESSHE